MFLAFYSRRRFSFKRFLNSPQGRLISGASLARELFALRLYKQNGQRNRKMFRASMRKCYGVNEARTAAGAQKG
jgi:hypothetical protein